MSRPAALIHVPADPVAGRDTGAIVELLAVEVGARRRARARGPRLIDMLLTAAIRHRLDDQDSADEPSWLRALRDLAPCARRRVASRTPCHFQFIPDRSAS
jgi:hypothetical protein